ncbi:MAG: flagellar motor switch protein FliM [Synergistales bacterium]
MVDVLNQSEIDKLINALASGEPSGPTTVAEKRVKTYNFRRPNKFSRDQIRAVQMLHESFARYLTSALSSMTRSMVSVEVANVEQVPYEEFVRSVLSPTTLGVLEVNPLGGKGLLEMNQALMFSLLDRMLGGRGETLQSLREFTDLERVVVEKILVCVLDELDGSWETIRAGDRIHFELIGRESNPFFVQIVPKAEMVLLVNMKIQVGLVEGRLNLCLPFHTLEPVLDRFNPQEWFISKEKPLSEEERLHLSDKLRAIRVELMGELCGTGLSVRELLDIRVGDVVNLGVAASEPGILYVGPLSKFEVAYGVSPRGCMAARILRVIRKPAETREEIQV